MWVVGLRFAARPAIARPAIARHALASQAYAVVTKEPAAAESSAALSLRGCASLAHVGSWCSRWAPVRRLRTVPPKPFEDQVRKKLMKEGMAQDPREIAAPGRISPFSARLVVMWQLADQEPLFTKWLIRAGVATTLIPTATAYILLTGTTFSPLLQGCLCWILKGDKKPLNDAFYKELSFAILFYVFLPITLPLFLFGSALELAVASSVVVLPISGAHLVLWQSMRWYPHWARAMRHLGAASSTTAVLVLVPTLLGWWDTAAGAAQKKHDKERTSADDDRSTRADGGAAKNVVAKPDEAATKWVAVGTLFTIFVVTLAALNHR